tara:strand:+ start:430 stop:600 length:171 start_codon:yes stop_codon:yes gene_type:complete
MKDKDEFGASGGMPTYDEMEFFKYSPEQKKIPKDFIIGISITTFILFAVWITIKLT